MGVRGSGIKTVVLVSYVSNHGQRRASHAFRGNSKQLIQQAPTSRIPSLYAPFVRPRRRECSRPLDIFLYAPPYALNRGRSTCDGAGRDYDHHVVGCCTCASRKGRFVASPSVARLLIPETRFAERLLSACRATTHGLLAAPSRARGESLPRASPFLR